MLTKVCGSGLLVPKHEASKDCPYVLRLPLLYVAFWNALCQGKPVEELYQAQQIFSRKPLEECKEAVDRFLGDLRDKGFLIAVED